MTLPVSSVLPLATNLVIVYPIKNKMKKNILIWAIVIMCGITIWLCHPVLFVSPNS